jgi:CheY-like chemotaxis protein
MDAAAAGRYPWGMVDAETRRIKILIVDDENDIVEALAMRFRHERRFSVETALSADEGLAKALASPPDLILLDLVMPRTDGWEFLRLLREEPKTARIPVVIMTAQSSSGDGAKAREAGVERLLAKPLDMGLLASTLQDSLQ